MASKVLEFDLGNGERCLSHVLSILIGPLTLDNGFNLSGQVSNQNVKCLILKCEDLLLFFASQGSQ